MLSLGWKYLYFVPKFNFEKCQSIFLKIFITSLVFLIQREFLVNVLNSLEKYHSYVPMRTTMAHTKQKRLLMGILGRSSIHAIMQIHGGEWTLAFRQVLNMS